MRAKVEIFKKNTNTCGVRYLDIGCREFRVSYDKVLKWNNFLLNDIFKPRSICCIFNVSLNESIFSHDTTTVLDKKYKFILSEYLTCSGVWLVDVFDENKKTVVEKQVDLSGM